MVIGVGCDLTSIARIERSLARLGTRFAERILAPTELALFASSPQQAAYLAKRFASKEAVAKALGTGIGAAASFQDISISSGANGQPRVELRGRAHATAAAMGVRLIKISISDEADMALAFAILQD